MSIAMVFLYGCLNSHRVSGPRCLTQGLNQKFATFMPDVDQTGLGFCYVLTQRALCWWTTRLTPSSSSDKATFTNYVPRQKQRRKEIKPTCSAEQNRFQPELTLPGPIYCQMHHDTDGDETVKPIVAFLKKHGNASIVSLGCGEEINRIDNHLRIMTALNLTYYVGVDCVPSIKPVSTNLFIDPDHMASMLSRYYHGRPHQFWEFMRLFPGTFVEELAEIHCAAIVCQRVFPDCKWEDVIISMQPKLVLQEDLHGCERQQLRGQHYVRNWSKIGLYGLQPFRPWQIFPGEKNLVLWRRRDYGQEQEERCKFRWLKRLAESFIG
jgi:hypothetical protein